MEFLSLKIVGALIYTAVVFLIGKNWSIVNSVSDIEALYKTAVAQLETLKTKLADEIAAAEAKVAALKSLV